MKKLFVGHLLENCDYAYGDRPKYRMPVLCDENDIGKIIYGKWLIGGGYAACSKFSISNSKTGKETKFYTAYKLVGGSLIQCNFDLDLSQSPFIKFRSSGNSFGNSIEDDGREYKVNKAIDSQPDIDEPNYDYHESGMRYMKMPA